MSQKKSCIGIFFKILLYFTTEDVRHSALVRIDVRMLLVSGNGRHELQKQSYTQQSQFSAADAALTEYNAVTSNAKMSTPVALEAVGLEVCHGPPGTLEHHQVSRPPTEKALNECAPTHTALSGAPGTREVGDRSSEAGETGRQMSPVAAARDNYRAVRRHHECTTTNSTSRGDASRDFHQRKTNRDAGDDVRQDLGVTTTEAALSDDRKPRAAVIRRRHSMTSFDSCRDSGTNVTSGGVSRTQHNDVTTLQVHRVTVTSSSQPETTSVLHGDVTATSWLPHQHLPTYSSSSSFQRQQFRDDVTRSSSVCANWDKHSLLLTSNDQPYQPNRVGASVGPRQHTTVITIVGKPVEVATQTR